MNSDFNNLLQYCNYVLTRKLHPPAVEIFQIYKVNVTSNNWAVLIFYYCSNNNGDIIEVTMPFEIFDGSIEYYIWQNFAINDDRNNS